MIKNKIKRIAFLVIIIGILLIIGAITSYLIKHSSKKETKRKGRFGRR